MKAHIVQSSKFVCLCWKGWAWSVSCKHRCACYSLSTRYASHFWTPPMEMYPKFSSLRHKGWTWTVEKIWWWNDQNDGIILSKIYLRVCVCVCVELWSLLTSVDMFHIGKKSNLMFWFGFRKFLCWYSIQQSNMRLSWPWNFSMFFVGLAEIYWKISDNMIVNKFKS